MADFSWTDTSIKVQGMYTDSVVCSKVFCTLSLCTRHYKSVLIDWLVDWLLWEEFEEKRRHTYKLVYRETKA